MSLITLKKTLSDIVEKDLQKKSMRCFLTNYLYNPSFRILLNYRIGRYLYHSKFVLFRHLSRHYRMKLVTKRNCDISYKAIIGANLKLIHPISIIIGEGVVIKDSVMIWQNVTLGVRSEGQENGNINYPTVENNVKIYAGAKIIGGLTIGENSIIGANAVVNKNVPANSVAVGVPCKILQ